MDLAATGRAWPGLDVQPLVERRTDQPQYGAEQRTAVTKWLRQHATINSQRRQAVQPSHASHHDAKNTARSALAVSQNVLQPPAHPSVSAW